MPEVLVTGARGFVGRALIARLQAEYPGEVIGVGRADLDLADGAAVDRALAELAPRAVVHLAASLRRDPSPESSAAQWRDTFLASRNVIEAAAANGIEHLLCAGSADELGGREGTLGPELTPLPITTYGLCKALLGQLAEFHARTSSLRLDWFRPFHIYGVGQHGSSVIAYAFAAASAGEPARFTDGTQLRDFVYIEDIVEWIAQGIAASGSGAGAGSGSGAGVGSGSGAGAGPGGGRELGVHHLGTGVATPVREVLRAIANEFPGADFELGALPRRDREPECQVSVLPGPPPADGSWSWQPRVTLAEGIARTAQWWRDGAGGR